METTKLKLPGANDFFTQEAYKVLRTNIQFCGADIRVIAITSCNENEGKTTVSLQLGRSLAELGKNVLVIDADMRKSVMVGRNTTATETKGLSEYLTGMDGLDDTIYGTQFPTLNVMFSGKYPPNPVELLNGSYFSRLLEYARQNYDYVIIDTPPLGRVIDAAVIATYCDGTLLVIGNTVRRHIARDTVNQLEKSGSKILGVVRNNIRKKGSGYYRYGRKYRYGKYGHYGYGSGYGYGYGFGYGYGQGGESRNKKGKDKEKAQ